ncbi:MAG: glucosyl-3-phosphoglycerate synthase [Actinobacteria bacterium]|nr:glucosyl-3-phosphoglycerate synthase [Actinomycetota bacterium]
MDPRAKRWFAAATTLAGDWPLARVLTDKRRSRRRISVVIPARNEQATIGEVVSRIRHDVVEAVPLVDELVVMDSLSVDDTARRARAAGARVYSVAEVAPEFGVQAGKGEALWKSMFVTTGDVVVFIDADLTEWGTHFVTGLVGPLLADDHVRLVKGYYDRLTDDLPGSTVAAGATAPAPPLEPQGGRVTELVARPLLALHWPQLAAVVQPLAGEWAIRRELFESLSVPIGYGVEFATLLDTVSQHGLEALAQVDLGRRAHRHQSVHDLGVMATEILAVAARRRETTVPEPVELAQYSREDDGWRTRPVPVRERPPIRDAARERPA